MMAKKIQLKIIVCDPESLGSADVEFRMERMLPKNAEGSKGEIEEIK